MMVDYTGKDTRQILLWLSELTKDKLITLKERSEILKKQTKQSKGITQ